MAYIKLHFDIISNENIGKSYESHSHSPGFNFRFGGFSSHIKHFVFLAKFKQSHLHKSNRHKTKEIYMQFSESDG